MATYYVDATGGDDTKAGTSASIAWQTIGKVNGETFGPGDSILFKRGETWTGTCLTIGWSGTVGDVITFGAYGSGANPILDGNDLVNCIYADTKSYLTFENLTCVTGTPACMGFETCTNITVTDCDLSDAANDNVLFISECSDCTVSGGNFHASRGIAGAGSGIEVADGCHDMLVDGATCYDNAGYGITVHSHAATDMPYNVTVRDCTSHNNSGHGINILKQNDPAQAARNILIDGCTVRDGSKMGITVNYSGATQVDGVTIQDCIVKGNGTYNFFIVGLNVLITNSVIHDGRMMRITDAQDVTVYNCTFYLTTYAGYKPIDVIASGTEQNITVKNCIIASPDPSCWMIACAAGTTTGADVDYNLYYNTGDLTAANRFTWNGVAKTWTSWLTDSGQDANSPTPADPLFTDAANDDFTLQTGSPAINAGVDVGLDYFGTAPDCGAYEYWRVTYRTSPVYRLWNPDNKPEYDEILTE